jgi:hypothetical protein
MLNGFYRWNSAGNGYGVYTAGSYVGAGPAPSNPNLIPSAQGFFVKLQTGATASLSMNESVKVGTQATFLRTANQQVQALKMEMRSATNGSSYLAELRFAEGASDELDVQLDAPYFPSAGLSFAMPVGTEKVILNTMATLTETRIVPLFVIAQAGSYLLNFAGIETFPAQVSIFLRDNLMGTIQDLRAQPQFTFAVGQSGSENGRFELVVSPVVITAAQLRNESASLQVYPNPVTGELLNLEISDAQGSDVQLVMTDVLGKVVVKSNTELINGKTQISVKGLGQGVYNLKVTSGTSSRIRRVVLQ